MFNTIKNSLYKSQPKIGWVHGLIICFGALVCAYLTMMLVSLLVQGDYVYKILPSMILTPIIISCYGLWLLFSPRIIDLLKKIVFCSVFISLLLILLIKVV
ncbi:hypothetical protein [Sulfurospirillum arcachonense]|uniref:hypothetical protein n=1 Tax=Sulfurospirillum arcachonense TaxID=57666 RepID=UPI00055C4923|nr:hypothetical protein [Sulfurospirillum arcachonense]